MIHVYENEQARSDKYTNEKESVTGNLPLNITKIDI